MLYFDIKNPTRTKVLDGEIVGWVLAAKIPFKTWSLMVSYPIDNPPKELFMRLNEIGFSDDDEFAPISPFNGVQETTFFKQGGGLFGDWNEVDSKSNMKLLRGLFEEVGFSLPAKYKMTLADLL